MADEQSPTPPVSELAAQLASHIANQPVAPPAGQSSSGQGDRAPRENRPPVTPVLLVKAADLPVREGARRAADAKVLRAKPVNVKAGPREGGGNREGRGERREGRPEGRPGGDRGPADVPAADVSISRRTSISKS